MVSILWSETKYYVSRTRALNLSWLGAFVSKQSKKIKADYELLHNMNGKNASERPVNPTEVFEVMYPVEGFITAIQRLDRKRVLYFYFQDTEGSIVKKRFKTVGEVLSHFGL